jgi:hypothetical protein
MVSGKGDLKVNLQKAPTAESFVAVPEVSEEVKVAETVAGMSPIEAAELSDIVVAESVSEETKEEVK